MSPYDADPSTASAPLPLVGSSLLARYLATRRRTMELVASLKPEDLVPQSMPDASPAKWHLAHTTWFFETFVLVPRGVDRFDDAFAYLFNSYYEALGSRHPRPQRGLITRPDAEEVFAYRRHVDHGMARVLESAGVDPELSTLMALGFAHEEQHQELLVADVVHLFAQNPLCPTYDPSPPPPARSKAATARRVEFPGGVFDIGQTGDGFAFDNEGPRHQTLLRPFALADRLVSNREWAAFISDGGYDRPEFWLSDGWAQAQMEEWRGPLYWRDDGAAFGRRGVRPLDPDAPVEHVSFYEADAYARWAGARLPLEAEWEVAATSERASELEDLFGAVWQWTASPYVAYPGFRPAPGAVGEYNGKFMVNQIVLRGSSHATAPGHSRTTYRNFFLPQQRWQFTGLRLAYD